MVWEWDRELKSNSALQTRSDGRYYLEYARDNYRNYDFETRLSVRIHAAIRFYSEDASVA